MTLRVVLSAVAAVFVVVGGAQAQYGGVSPSPAQVQSAQPAQEKGVKARSLVTSMGLFREVANVPIVLTGQIVEIEPGGQTGRQRHMVPAYLYVLEGTLTTNTEGGPVSVGGVQYHSEGQSFMGAAGVWHNYSNTGQKPVKYLLLLISTPGGATTQKAGADD